MNIPRAVRLATCCAIVATATPVAVAQNYPNRPVRIIAQFTPGTSTDILARVIG